ncbi:MAG: rhodanese-like domain-containing protein [Chromatiales bacterium]
MPEIEIKDIRPDEAFELQREDPNAVIVDVRTTMEYQYVGHPAGALHVPWMEAPEWRVLPDFAERIRHALRGVGPAENVTVMTICRSGKRSRAAAEALAEYGFKRLYNVAEGFEGDLDAHKHRGRVNGWRQRGLPWEQS